MPKFFNVSCKITAFSRASSLSPSASGLPGFKMLREGRRYVFSLFATATAGLPCGATSTAVAVASISTGLRSASSSFRISRAASGAGLSARSLPITGGVTVLADTAERTGRVQGKSGSASFIRCSAGASGSSSSWSGPYSSTERKPPGAASGTYSLWAGVSGSDGSTGGTAASPIASTASLRSSSRLFSSSFSMSKI